jgi:hypothetical protein
MPTYTASFDSRRTPMEAAPDGNAGERSPGPPRLLRKDEDVTRNLDRSAARSSTSDPHALRAPAIGGGPPPVVEPSTTLPSPPARLAIPPRAGVDAALAAVPRGVPTGRLSRDALEGPLRDRRRFDRCRIPQGVEVQVDALVYNGAAVGVDVHARPRDEPLAFCIEQVVRETSFVQELAVNRVSLRL